MAVIHIYTGNGKGKTTAALGQAFRACGHNWRVIMIQFMKGDPSYGEIKSAEKLKNFEIYQFGTKNFVNKNNPSKEDIERAKEGLEFARKIIETGKYDMVILDEINVAVDFGLIALEDVLDLLKKVPEETVLILTGRYADEKIFEYADLVSKIEEIKHPYQKGISAIEGIEF
ncbi:cob(I)yrinic acid a,c-diamide adenosyltransferase [bacterium]|nr:cob(I)yrinic acid a,c-diamide adenosyltransferase [bacterium]